jgi:hypothetical protein
MTDKKPLFLSVIFDEIMLNKNLIKLLITEY